MIWEKMEERSRRRRVVSPTLCASKSWNQMSSRPGRLRPHEPTLLTSAYRASRNPLPCNSVSKCGIRSAVHLAIRDWSIKTCKLSLIRQLSKGNSPCPRSSLDIVLNNSHAQIRESHTRGISLAREQLSEMPTTQLPKWTAFRSAL